jgi:signal transduction histidine kinase
MIFNFSEKIRAGYLTAFILLLISYGLTFYTTQQLSTQNRRVNHTNEVINKLGELESYLKDAETGFRGYILMKDEKFLAPYYTSKKNVDSTYEFLQKNLFKNLQQQDVELQKQRLAYLHQLTETKYTIIREGISEFKESDMAVTDSLKIRAYRGKEIMDSIRFTIGILKTRENETLDIRTGKVKSAATAIKVINLTSLVIAILIALYSVISYNEENKAKKEASKKTEEYRHRLEERVGDLKKMNQELVSLRSMEKFATTGRLARVIAHEIRNPLTNIGLAADQLKSEMPENEDAAMLLEMINRNGTRINQLITDLLSSTKFSELNYNSVSINQLLDEALELANDRVQLKKITVQKKYSTDICNVSADKEKLKIAFLNIIVNAVEAMPAEKGLLRLKTQGKENKCVITITDNGTGIDKETQSKLFEPYFTSKATGNGLGLTNTQNIILNHKGAIEVESEPGKGTSFIITLDFPEN